MPHKKAEKFKTGNGKIIYASQQTLYINGYKHSDIRKELKDALGDDYVQFEVTEIKGKNVGVLICHNPNSQENLDTIQMYSRKIGGMPVFQPHLMTFDEKLRKFILKN